MKVSPASSGPTTMLAASSVESRWIELPRTSSSVRRIAMSWTWSGARIVSSAGSSAASPTGVRRIAVRRIAVRRIAVGSGPTSGP